MRLRVTRPASFCIDTPRVSGLRSIGQSIAACCSAAMSRAKRRVEELGEQVVSAAVGDIFARSMSAAVGRYAAHARVEEQLERLGTLLIMVHSVVEAAEGVHIRSWWLRRWLWRFRDAALDGDELLRSFRRQQKADEEAAGGGRRLWNAARRVFRSAKSLLMLAGDDDSTAARVSAAVASLEGASMGLADFLKLLDMEIRRPQQEAPPLPPRVIPSIDEEAQGNNDDYRWRKSGSTTLITRQQYDDDATGGDPSSRRRRIPITEEILHGVLLDVPPPPPPRRRGSSDDEPSSSLAGASESEHDDLSYTSYKFTLLILSQNFERVMSMHTATTTQAAAPPASPSSPARLRVVVGDIRGAVDASDVPEVHGKRWLAEWRRELQGVADGAERALIPAAETAVAEAGGGEAGRIAASRDETGDDDEVRRTARSVHTAAAHLECFVTLVRFAVSHGIPTA
ncbi:unnamed protein product [Urochloa decumbens]|uniref:Disease resistance N-terminal domain-containing protein n=1 Tax=Urochloa decumbens TaxID=240449 RepID=A0ABC9FMQ5_9POAL